LMNNGLTLVKKHELPNRMGRIIITKQACE
jgi:hypothetical protein